MLENMSKVKCGACGESKVELFTDSEYKLVAVCTVCDSETDLVVQRPKVEFKWGDKGEGCLCVF